LEIDPNLVGIIMTGAGTIATAVAALQTGALDYILKPFKLRDMLPVLARGANRLRYSAKRSCIRVENSPIVDSASPSWRMTKDAWRAIGLGVVRTCNGIGNTLL